MLLDFLGVVTVDYRRTLGMHQSTDKLRASEHKNKTPDSRETDFDQAVERVHRKYGSDVPAFLRDVKRAIILKRESDK